MSETRDGGPAFPNPALVDANYRPKPGDWGMSLRDWFAGQALEGMLAHSTRYRPRPGSPENWYDAISEESYQIADAMLKAREVQS